MLFSGQRLKYTAHAQASQGSHTVACTPNLLIAMQLLIVALTIFEGIAPPYGYTFVQIPCQYLTLIIWAWLQVQKPTTAMIKKGLKVNERTLSSSFR